MKLAPPSGLAPTAIRPPCASAICRARVRPIPVWLFPTAALAALLAVAGQAPLAARQRPLLALRYE